MSASPPTPPPQKNGRNAVDLVQQPLPSSFLEGELCTGNNKEVTVIRGGRKSVTKQEIHLCPI